MKLESRGRDRSGPVLGVLVGGVLAAAGAVAALWFRLGLPLPVCRFKEWTGVPCPTCGSTRMVEALLSGDVLGAAAWNPLVFFGLAAVAIWTALSVARLASGRFGRRLVLSSRERLTLRVLAVGVLLAGWGYVIWRGV